LPSAEPSFTAIGPGTPAGRLLRSFWQPIHLSADLPAKKAVPVHVLGEDFTLYRSESGIPHLIAPFCAHRGLQLSAGRVEGDRLHCFYHGWTYDGTGQCVEQPAEKRPFCDKVRIAGYPVHEYIGLIFAYLGDGEPPAFPRLDAFERDGFIEARKSVRPWSFFNQLENSVDEVHFNFAHRRSDFAEVGWTEEIPDLAGEETDYGILRIGKRGNAVRKSYILMPNCMYSPGYDNTMGWGEHLAWRVPIDDVSHASFVVKCIHKSGDDLATYHKVRATERAQLAALEPADRVTDRILAGELHIDALPDRPDLIAIQDMVALRGQSKDRDRSDDLLAASDLQVALLRRIWKREMQAIETGQPIKAWRVPPDLMPVGMGQD
jgi:5,5'-dehydrodivanillate O-demethylase